MPTKPAAKIPTPQQTSVRDLLIMVTLAGITLAAFAGVKNCGFLNYDDDGYVSHNAHVQAGLTPDSIKWAFTTGDESNYHPLTWLSLMLDAQLNQVLATHSGSAQWNPAPIFHATNVVLHLLNALLIFALLRAMTGSSWRSALVAAIFAVHPLRVESVAWVSERKDVLSASLGLLAMLAYVHYCRVPHWRPYALMLVLFTLSLLAKPMLVTLPFLLLLLDFWPLRRWTPSPASTFPIPPPTSHIPIAPARSPAWLLLEKLPLLLLSIASSIATVIAQRAGGAVRSLSQTPITARLANVPVSYVRYLRNMVWYRDLSVNYPYPHAWPPVLVATTTMVLLVVTAVVLWRGRQNPWLAVGWLWFIGMLIPVIGIVQVGLQSMADRYTYLPMLGVLIMAVWSVPQRLLDVRAVRTLAPLGAAGLLAVLCHATQQHVEYWRDGITLARHAIALGPDNFTAEYNLAGAMFSSSDLQGAAQHFRQALRINPGSAVTHNNYALVLQSAGRLPEALDEYHQALLLDPDLPDAHNNIGMIQRNAHHLPEAIAEFRKAIERRPDFPEAHNNLGLALGESGDHAGAIGQYEMALNANPDLPNAHFNLGIALEEADRMPEAIAHLRQAVKLQPDNDTYSAALSQAIHMYASRQRGL